MTHDERRLLETVKAYLKITWDSDDELLTGYIERGKARLNQIAGTELDFDSEGQPRALLLDYVRSANSQALEVFEKNFEAELLALHIDTNAASVTLEEEDDADTAS